MATDFTIMLADRPGELARLGEALGLEWDRVRLTEARAWVRTSKNGDPREVQLRADLAAALTVLANGRTSGRVFRFHQGGAGGRVSGRLGSVRYSSDPRRYSTRAGCSAR